MTARKNAPPREEGPERIWLWPFVVDGETEWQASQTDTGTLYVRADTLTREPTEADVERVARIIDPLAFKSAESMRVYCAGQGDDSDMIDLYIEKTYGGLMRQARVDALAAINAWRNP